MKVNAKMKMIVAAVALSVTGISQAATIEAGNNGELMFTIWDQTATKEASVNIGLSVNMNAFLPTAMTPVAGTTVNFGNIFTNPAYVQYLGTGSGKTHNLADLKWNVVASDDSSDFERELTTEQLGNTISVNNAGAQSMAQNTAAYNVKLMNDYPPNPTANPPFAGSPGPCDPCGTDVKALPKYAGDNFGSDFNGSLSGIFNNAGTVGSELGFYYFSSTVGSSGYDKTGGDPADVMRYENAGGLGKFTLSANGDLSYSIPAAIPVPAAVWLLGSALVGLVGVARRRNNAAA